MSIYFFCFLKLCKNTEMTGVEELTKNRLVKELHRLPIYKYHRHNLRPWDRPLPALVLQEADAQQRWEIEPPSPCLIFSALFGCLAMYQLVWILPVLTNLKYITETWKNVELPSVVYDEPKVWLSLWVVAHLCSGLTLWFVWLTGGFTKHIPELLPIAIAFFGECVWVDIAAYSRRLDALVVDWIVITICVAVAAVLLWQKKIAIGAIFLMPHLAGSFSMIVYSAAFYSLHGPTYVWLGDMPREPTPTPTS